MLSSRLEAEHDEELEDSGRDSGNLEELDFKDFSRDVLLIKDEVKMRRQQWTGPTA